MKVLKIIVIVIAALVLIGACGYLYASSGIKSKTGYAKLATPRVNALLSVNVGPRGLGPVRWLVEKITESSAHDHELPERLIHSVMQELQGVQLRIYDVGSNRQAFDSAIAESVVALKEKGWQTLMTVRERDERIVVLQYGNDEEIEGLSIMVSIPDNAMFLNLIGPFDPQAIAEAANQGLDNRTAFAQYSLQ
jgi:hypothetical protein